MNTIIEHLRRDGRISGYKINVHRKESYELFFIKDRLETLRCTDTCDKSVTVYVEHDGFLGDAQFFVYPSTTEQQLAQRIDTAVSQARIIQNPMYALPQGETGDYRVETNLDAFSPAELAAHIAQSAFSANCDKSCALNSLEIFLVRHTETVTNSCGLHKTQTRYNVTLEAIPTCNGEKQSVELYELIETGNLDEAALAREIAGKLEDVKARNDAVIPSVPISCNVILNAQELAEFFINFPWDLHYSSVYSQSSLYYKGDAIQKNPTGDLIGITMAGEVPGCVHSSKFDADGLKLGSIRLIDGGKVVNYYGSNRYGQYLGETPTGELRCLLLDAGSAEESAFTAGPYLEVRSMSGLQVDFYSDYIGGEIRLAYYHDGTTVTPVTGISISGKLSEILEFIRFSRSTAVFGSYCGPEKALLTGMNIF